MQGKHSPIQRKKPTNHTRGDDQRQGTVRQWREVERQLVVSSGN